MSTANATLQSSAGSAGYEPMLAAFDALDATIGLPAIRSAERMDDHALFDNIARLTRGVHEAIRTMNPHARLDEGQRSESRDSLEYVVSLTERAAHRTLDLVESAVPIADTIAREMRETGARSLKRDDPAASGQLALHLEENALRAEQLRALLTDILLAQDYQDLSGQIIRRVANLLRDVESKLVSLVKMAASLNSATGLPDESNWAPVPFSATEAEGPIIPGSGRTDVLPGQDEVDDLLSKLGF